MPQITKPRRTSSAANRRYRAKAQSHGMTEVRLMVPASTVPWFKSQAREARRAHRKALALTAATMDHGTSTHGTPQNAPSTPSAEGD